MFATDGGEIAIAIISTLGGIAVAAIAAWAAMSAARTQRKPSILGRGDPDDVRSELAAERVRRIQAEAERDVWKEIALPHRGIVDPDIGT